MSASYSPAVSQQGPLSLPSSRGRVSASTGAGEKPQLPATTVVTPCSRKHFSSVGVIVQGKGPVHVRMGIYEARSHNATGRVNDRICCRKRFSGSQERLDPVTVYEDVTITSLAASTIDYLAATKQRRFHPTPPLFCATQLKLTSGPRTEPRTRPPSRSSPRNTPPGSASDLPGRLACSLKYAAGVQKFKYSLAQRASLDSSVQDGASKERSSRFQHGFEVLEHNPLGPHRTRQAVEQIGQAHRIERRSIDLNRVQDVPESRSPDGIEPDASPPRRDCWDSGPSRPAEGLR